MHVLITGGAGFIGSNLVRYLTEAGVGTVRVLDDLSTGRHSNLAGTVEHELIVGSILDTSTLTRAVNGVDAVVHLGAIPSVPRSIAHPVATHDANTTGTLNVLEAARKHQVQHVIVASSSSVYGANPQIPKIESSWTRPMSPYAVSKLTTEAYAIAYYYSFGLKTLAFRFFNVYGPGQAADHAYAAVIPKFIDAALSERPLEIYGDGMQSRDFTYVDTVCEVILQALVGQVQSATPVNLAYGTTTDLITLADAIESKLDVELERHFKEPRVGDVKASMADSSLVRDMFPDVVPTSLDNGLDRTITWFRRQRGSK